MPNRSASWLNNRVIVSPGLDAARSLLPVLNKANRNEIGI